MVPQVVINTVVVGIGKQHIFVFEKKKKREKVFGQRARKPVSQEMRNLASPQARTIETNSDPSMEIPGPLFFFSLPVP